jgi:hypothetical protein
LPFRFAALRVHAAYMRSAAALATRALGPRRSISVRRALTRRALTIGAISLLAAGVPAAGAGATPESSIATAMVNGPSPGDLSLVVVGGADAVHISTASLGAGLVRVATPAVTGGQPNAARDGDQIVVSNTAGRPSSTPAVLDIVLSRRVQWSITLNGGARDASVDMRGGSLSALTFADGVAHVSAQLPPATGLERVTLAGGASALTLTAPAGSPAQVVAAAGAAKIDLDGATHPGVAGGSVFTEPGWNQARHRYAIDLTSGVSRFAFTRTGRRA